MKRIILTFLIFTIGFVYAQDKKEMKYNFKIATDAPDGSSWIMAFKDIDKEIKKVSNGEAGLTLYPASLMGNQSDVIKKMKLGQLNGAGLSSGGVQLIYKDFAIMGFPLIFNDYKEYDYAVTKMDKFYKEEIEKQGFVLMAWTEVGIIYVFSKKKVNSVETLASSKPIIMEGDVVSKALYDEINIKPIPLQMADILTSLQTGQVDTIFSSTYGLIVTQWFTKVNYMADFPITFMIGAVVLEKSMFDSMPKEYQTALTKSFNENFKKLSLKVRKDNDNARISLEKYGIKPLNVNDKDKQKFYEVVEKTHDKLTEKDYSRDILNKIKATVKEYRSQKK